MSEKKNIDRLFQEKFRNFEVSPERDLWPDISARLNGDDKRRRIIPLWWKLGGVAALLALIFLAGYGIFNSQQGDLPLENPVTAVPAKTTEQEQQKNSDPFIDKEKLKETFNTNNQNTVVEASEENAKNVEEKNAGAEKGMPSKSQGQVSKGSSSLSRSALTSTEGKAEKASQKNETTYQSSNAVVAGIDTKLDAEKQGVEKSSVGLKDEAGGNASKTETSKEVADTPATDIAANNNDGKKSLLDVIAEQEKEKETEVVEAASKKRWSISPSLAPVYYNSVDNGSPISAEFAGNQKSGDINLSYGVNVAYQISKRLSVRSGVNKVNYGYNTNDIEFTSSLQSRRFSNINYVDNSETVFISNDLQDQGFQSEVTSGKTLSYDGNLKQELGYVEVPLEMKYRLLDKKFGVNIIGGVSSLFLTDNRVSVETNDKMTEIGKANNLNEINFSTNIGLGFDYKISESLQLNLEPMFKYQINTFSNDGGGFKPYTLGVHTGFSFRF